MLKDWTDEDGKLRVYTWPGGYPVMYLMSDGESVCPACAQMAQDEGLGGADDPQWDIRDGYIHWEGPAEVCAHCNKAVESAYGEEPEEPDDSTAAACSCYPGEGPLYSTHWMDCPARP